MKIRDDDAGLLVDDVTRRCDEMIQLVSGRARGCNDVLSAFSRCEQGLRPHRRHQNVDVFASFSKTFFLGVLRLGALSG